MILVCGEALMDVFAAEQTPTGLMLDARVGGSPFNVAVGLARMTQPVAFLSAVSTGFLGDRLMSALQAEGVNTSAVARTAAPTTLSLVGLDAQGVPAYSFYGHGAADRQLHLADLAALNAFGDGLKAVHLGSYAAVVELTASTLRALVEREHTRCLIAYDPQPAPERGARLECVAAHCGVDVAAHALAENQRRRSGALAARRGGGRLCVACLVARRDLGRRHARW